MEEIIEVRFANDEKDFIFNKGVNKGYLQLPTKLSRCYLFHDRAKVLYTLLSTYASLSESRECFPSRETIKAECGGWGNDKVSKAIEELEEANLIERISREGLTTLYRIFDLHYSTVIAHSELLHTIRLTYRAERKQNEFYKYLSEYKKSSLYKEVSDLNNPLEMRQEIEKWFKEKISGTKPNSSIEETRPKRTMSHHIGTVIKDKGEISKTDPMQDGKPRKEKKSKNPDEVSIDQWNTHHFLAYFEKVWLQHKNLPYPAKMKEDLSALKHVLTQVNNPEQVRTMIDKYFEVTDSTRHGVHNFSSAFVQQKLINLLNSNSSTSYKKHNGKSTDMEVDDEWMKNFLEGE